VKKAASSISPYAKNQTIMFSRQYFMSFDPYDFAFNFWSLLTTEREDLAGGIALANLEVPLLLSNAAWYPKVGELQSVAEWYSKRGLPPAMIVPKELSKDLLQEGPFRLEQTFCFTPVATPSLLRLNQYTVEQSSWLRSRVAADLLASSFGGAEWGPGLSQTLSRALQDSSQVRSYLAYQDKAVASMITLEQDGILAAMLTSDASRFTRTLLGEASNLGLQPYLFEAATTSHVKPELCLERWSIA
jgi:hypothetical protein